MSSHPPPAVCKKHCVHLSVLTNIPHLWKETKTTPGKKAQLPLMTSHRVELSAFKDTLSDSAKEAQGELLSSGFTHLPQDSKVNFASHMIFFFFYPAYVASIKALMFNFPSARPSPVCAQTSSLTLSGRDESRRDAFTGQLSFTGDAEAQPRQTRPTA